MQSRFGHVALATPNGLLRTPRILCYGSGWLYSSALRFVPPALEVLAEIKTTIFSKTNERVYFSYRTSEVKQTSTLQKQIEKSQKKCNANTYKVT